MQTMTMQRFFCNCFIGEFHIPADKLEDDDEILCPYCGEEPHSHDVRIVEVYTAKEKEVRA